MATARIFPTKDAIDTWDLGSNICRLPTLMVASSSFSYWGGNDTQMGQNGNIPQIGSLTTLPSRGEATWGNTPFDAGLCALSELPLTLVKWRTQPWAEPLWPFWAKRPKFTQKWSLEISHLRITIERSLGLLRGCRPKLCFSFATRVEVQSIMETFLTPQSLNHTINGKKCIYRRYWHEHIFGSLRCKNMSKHFWSRPIVGTLKYAHYG